VVGGLLPCAPLTELELRLELELELEEEEEDWPVYHPGGGSCSLGWGFSFWGVMPAGQL